MPNKDTEPIVTDSPKDILEEKRREFQEEISHGKSVKKQSERKPRSKKELLLGIFLMCLLLVALGSFAAYNFWYQNPERVVGDAVVRALSAPTVNFTGTYTLGNTFTVQATGGTAGVKGTKLTANISTVIGGKANKLSTDAVMDKDGNVYLSAAGIKTALGSDLIADAANPGTYANLLAQKVEGKWLKITSSELSSYSKKYAAIQSCIESVFQKNQTDQPLLGQAVGMYQQNTFLVVDKIVGTKNGSTGYQLHADTDKLKAFLTQFKTTSLYQQFHECDSVTFDLNVDTFVQQFDPKKTSITSLVLWINGNHDITSIDAENGKGDITGTLSVQPKFNQEVKIIVPTETITLSQLHSYVLDGIQSLTLSKQDDAASKAAYQALVDKLRAEP